MFDNFVSRNQFGANNTRDTETFSDQPVEDRTKVHEYNNDFDEYNTGNYTVTLLGAAGTAFASIAGDGGLIQAITSANANAGYVLQNVRATFTIASGFRLFCEFLFSIDNILANVIAGLLNTTATAFTPASQTDGVYLTALGNGQVNINVAVGGVRTQVANVAQLAGGLGNLVTFKFFWDGAIRSAAPNGVIVWEVSGPGVVAAARGEIAAPVNFPGATVINTTFGVTASTAAVRTANLDLFSVIKERLNSLATPVF